MVYLVPIQYGSINLNFVLLKMNVTFSGNGSAIGVAARSTHNVTLVKHSIPHIELTNSQFLAFDFTGKKSFFVPVIDGYNGSIRLESHDTYATGTGGVLQGEMFEIELVLCSIDVGCLILMEPMEVRWSATFRLNDTNFHSGQLAIVMDNYGTKRESCRPAIIKLEYTSAQTDVTYVGDVKLTKGELCHEINYDYYGFRLSNPDAFAIVTFY